jgi:GntR family transcriptional regulator, transcriptional repressor for pyruvate dehydrogenase complex
MSGLKAVARVTLAEQVALQVADMIAGKRWKPGERLPPEMELCEALNVGRSTLREALKSLAFVGMVRMRAGDGTYVAEPSRGLLDRILAKGLLQTEKDLADVCETRIVLETQLAAFAAERVKPDGLARLEALIQEGKRRLGGEGRSYIDADLDFHLAVADCSGNRLLPRLLADIRGLLVEWIAKSQELTGVRENAQEQHERIFRCIADRNPEGARKEMQAHLETFERAYKLLGKISVGDGPQRGKTAI